jgi:ABC-type polysaccharide transport system permease subunit
MTHLRAAGEESGGRHQRILRKGTAVRGSSFTMIIIYSSLRGIPSELYDSARIDGANEVQIALRVKG